MYNYVNKYNRLQSKTNEYLPGQKGLLDGEPLTDSLYAPGCRFISIELDAVNEWFGFIS